MPVLRLQVDAFSCCRLQLLLQHLVQVVASLHGHPSATCANGAVSAAAVHVAQACNNAQLHD